MTKEEIIKMVKKHMKTINLDYDKDYGFDCWDKDRKEDRSGIIRNLYRVIFEFPDYVERDQQGNIIECVEGHIGSCYIDADTYEILYYSYHHGYIEVDGTWG